VPESTLTLLHYALQYAVDALEALAVIAILVGAALGTISFAVQFTRGNARAFEIYRNRVGRALLMGLQLLVAGDVVKTVVLDESLESVVVLAILVLVRTFLSWSTIIEIEGRWPWISRQDPRGSIETRAN